MTGAVALVVAEVRDGALAASGGETVGLARRLVGPGGTVVAVVVDRAPEAGESLGKSGASRVVAISGGSGAGFLGAPASAIAARATSDDAQLIVLPSSTWGRDLAARLSARWDAPAATNVVDVRGTLGTAIVAVRPVFGGRATEELELTGPRAIVALRPHAFGNPAPEGAAVPIEEVPAAGPPPEVSGSRLGVDAAGGGSGPDLADAAIVVAGGRGLGAPEKFALVEELAASLGAAVGASRAVTDAGWRPGALQVGQTGRSVSPQLYLAVGISGAIQHVVGMAGSRVIVAINSDAQAPIFKVSDYGVVGDLFQLLPPLIAEIRRVRAQS